MIHLGLFLIVFAYLSIQYLVNIEYFTLLSIKHNIKPLHGYLLVLCVLMAFVESIFWGGYLIYSWISS